MTAVESPDWRVNAENAGMSFRWENDFIASSPGS
jgi:hypothetical protein